MCSGHINSYSLYKKNSNLQTQYNQHIMKKITTLLVLLTLGLVQAQDSTEVEKRRANELGFEFVGLVDGQLTFTYERTFGKHWSAIIGGGPKSRRV